MAKKKEEVTYEYAPFGDKIVRRKQDSTDEWKEVPEDDLLNATIQLQVAALVKVERARMRRQGLGPPFARIIRHNGDRNE